MFAQDPTKSSEEFKQFFSYVSQKQMPQFWCDYDRGVLSFEQVAQALAEYRGVDQDFASAMIRTAIGRQETIKPTEALIEDLKLAGYKLFVLSNMAHEFIEFLRQKPVYANFDGEVVSCEEGVVKPMPEIYDILLSRYQLEPEHTIFIDDREENVVAARQKGIVAFHFDRNDYQQSCDLLREMLL